jgi:hypothetical protein
VAPELQPVAGTFKLPNAREDFDYNPQLRDTLRRIVANDLNLNQRVRFTLLYSNDALNEGRYKTGQSALDSDNTVKTNSAQTAYVRRDGCYNEAGLYIGRKTTPDWIKINPVSGMLYGTPGLNDAPHTLALNNPDTLTVVAEDEGGLTDVRTYILEVDSTNHRPRLVGRPPIQCVEAGKAYNDSLCVSDRDFGRIRFTERVTLQVIDPPGIFTIDSAIINGQTTDTVCFHIRAAAIPANLAGKKVDITIVATDASGLTDTLRYKISVSEQVIFSMPIWISNTNATTGSNAFQRLVFGIAQNATTGDEAPPQQGQLDSNYCEYELPPIPPPDVFDARWSIVTRQGILRSIFPEVPSADQGVIAWKGTFQPGALETGSPNFPIRICWSLAAAQASPKSIQLRDQTESIFNVDMKTGAYKALAGVVVRKITADSICVEISLTTLKGFKIVYGSTDAGVDEPTTGIANAYSLAPNVPNPFANSTEISFYAPRTGDVKIDLFDIHGSLVKTLTNGTVASGNHTIVWDGTDEKGKAVASGTYTYRLSAGSTVLTRTMILMK